MNQQPVQEAPHAERLHESRVQPPKKHSRLGLIFAIIGIALVMGVGGFAIGLQVGKSSSSTNKNSTSAPGGSMNGQRSGNMGTMGTVTAISSTSITVKDTRENKETTYSITSSTTVTDNGASSSVSAIKTGDQVLIRTSSSGSSDSSSKVATSIQLNPSMPSGGQGGGPNGTSGSDSDQPATSSDPSN